MAEKFGKQVKIYYTNNKQTTSVTGIDASSYILFNGGSNHIYTHGKDFAADPSHTHKFLELSDVKDTFSKPADTTNTWVPVDVNGKIYHREIPVAYNHDPSTLSVNSANTANIANIANSLYASCASNDYIGIKGGGSNDNGYLEIYTGDNGNEPIYLRQYNYDSSVAIHSATLLDSNGNTSFPGIISSNGHTVLTNRIDPIISVACTSSGILTFTSNNNNKYEFNFNHTHDLSQLTGKIKVECLPDAALKDTTYSYSVTQSATNNNANPYLTLTPSNSGTVSNIQLAGGNNVTITRDSASKIIISSSWRPLGTGSNDAAAGNHNHDDKYALAHQSSFQFNTSHNSNIVTFDQNTPTNGPGGWVNGFVSTHNNYLSSFIVNTHRSSNWYVGYSENNSAPTWYTLIHSGNIGSYNAGSANKVNNALSWSGFSSGSFDGSSTKTIIIPSKVSQLSNDSGYITTNHTHDSLVVDYADSTSFNAPYHDFQVLYAGGNNGIEGRPSDVDAFGLLRFRVASGWSGQMLLANGGDLYIRSAVDGSFNKSLPWKRIIDSGNIRSQSVNYANSAGNADTAIKLKDYNGSNNIYCGYAGDGLTSDNIGWMVGIKANPTGNDIYYKNVSKSELQKWLGLGANNFVKALDTSNDNIDKDWGQSFKTFDPIPSGTPPEQNSNISLLSIGDDFNRRKQLAFMYDNDNIYYRRHTDGGFTNWRNIAFVDSNVASATKLKDYNGSTNIYCGFAGDGLNSDNIGYMVGIQTNTGNDIYYKDVSKSELQKWLGLDSYVKKSGDTMFGCLNATVIELFAPTPYIDFHYNNSSSDYTSRIVEYTSGVLTITGGLEIYNNLSAQGGKFSTDDDGAYWTSDIRKKHDFSNITKDIADKFFEKNYFKHFKWNDTNHDSWGVAAQEFEEWAPEAINTNEDGFKSANYDVAEAKAIAAMTYKIKEQQVTINELKEKLKNFEKMLNKLI